MARKTQPSRPEERQAKAQALETEWSEAEADAGEPKGDAEAATPEVFAPLSPAELVPYLRLAPALLAISPAGGTAEDKAEARALLEADVSEAAAMVADAVGPLPPVAGFVRSWRVVAALADLGARYWCRRRLGRPAAEPPQTMAVVREVGR